MKNIFYSWQSDLPNNTNRGFIEKSLKLAIDEIAREDIHLEIAIDRDIKNTNGTPEIVTTLFDKIDKCQVFVADVSLINLKGKRTPNPNVLLELGYAAKCVGWENIVCIFNTFYGRPEELPFDLRFRSPLQYHVQKEDLDKADERSELSRKLKKALTGILHKQHSKDVIYGHIKEQVDLHIMSLSRTLFRFIHGHINFITPHELFSMLDLKDDELAHIFQSKDFLGFQIFKDYASLQTGFQQIINNPIFAKHIDDSKVACLITLNQAVYLLDENLKQRKDLFLKKEVKAKEYTVLPGKTINPDNRQGRFLLLKIQKDDQGIVIDSGDFPKYRENDLLSYFSVGDCFILILLLKDVFKALEEVIAAWDGNITLNPALIE